MRSCDIFFKKNPHVYFWTWTFTDVYDYWMYEPKFKAIMRRFTQHDLHSYIPGLSGIKVIEKHPGGKTGLSHGFHYHILLNRRIDIDVLRREGARYGLGWCWVKEIKGQSKPRLSKYLAKYLTKAGPKMPKGMRKWSKFGGFKGKKVKQITVDSEFHRNIRQVADGRQVDYFTTIMISRFTSLYGAYKDWPETAKETISPSWVKVMLRQKEESRELYERGKFRRQFPSCRWCGQDIKIPWTSRIVFISRRDAQEWATQNNQVLGHTWVCQRTFQNEGFVAIHGDFLHRVNENV